jgi:regulator of protease activity HflC (stomatin/prohibitin superfamily)
MSDDTSFLSRLLQSIRAALKRSSAGLGTTAETAAVLGRGLGRSVHQSRGLLIGVAVAVAGAYVLVEHPPVQTVPRGDVGVRTNLFTGSAAEFHEGTALVLPGIHEMRSFPLRDQLYRPTSGRDAPFQSVEGLSFGVDLAIRYALDTTRIVALARSLPDDVGHDVVQPAVQGVIYKVFARYTVREIFSSKRDEIQQAIETELRGKLAVDGIVLRSVQMGKVELPAEYRAGMDRLLSEELETEKMKYTLELKERGVKASELDAQADKVRRETAATAAGNEQVIAAQAQEEAMKHVLPFKQKQIEQRQLEAEADKVSRIRVAEGSAQARRIEAAGEADSRQKLADAEAYRLDKVGRTNSEQMAREGVLLSRHPLLIQKTVADKLSDKITVIIAPPGTDGKFIGAGLIGGGNMGKVDKGEASTDADKANSKEGE